MLRGSVQRSLKPRLLRRNCSTTGPSMKTPYEGNRGSRSGRKWLWVLTGSVVATEGVLVYASKDDRVRNVIETNIPSSKVLIDAAGTMSTWGQNIFGKISSYTKSTEASAISKQEISALPSSVPVEKTPSVLDTPLPEAAPVKEKASVAPVTPVKETVPETPMKEAALNPVQPKKDVPSLDVSEKAIAACISQALSGIDQAVKDSKDYIEALSADILNSTQSASSAKDEIRAKSLQQVQTVVESVRSEISKAFESVNFTSKKDELVASLRKLDDAVRNLNLATLEAEAFKVYSQNYSEQVQQELKSKTMEGAPEDVFLPLDTPKDGNLSNKELNQFIAFGYRKLRYLQDELAKFESNAKKSLKAALEQQQADVEKVYASKLEEEIAITKQQLAVDHEQELAAMEILLQESHNDELARQASAHSQHLQDVLESQERQLRAKFESNVQEQLAFERAKFHQELGSLLARVTAIRKVLNKRADVDRLSSKSHQLWIASQALHDELNNIDGTKPAIVVRPFLNSIQSAFGNDEFVATLVSQFDDNNEVPSHSALQSRFDKVRRVCRRVAVVSDPPTLSSYFWSYLRSLLVFDPSPMPILVDGEGNKYIEGANLDTLAILSTAQKLLDNNELELCVRLMNQLPSEARNVAHDWLADARRLLELRQAANGLLAFAAANSAVGFLSYEGLK